MQEETRQDLNQEVARLPEPSTSLLRALDDVRTSLQGFLCPVSV